METIDRKKKLEGISSTIRDVPDFPKKGIIFKDITTVLQDGQLFKDAVDLLAAPFQGKGIAKVIGIEARGFIFGAAVAYSLGCGFVPVRKKGKLPAQTKSVTYDLEYGTDTLEIHMDSISAGEPVVIIDDLLATGGTMAGVVTLVKELQADIKGIQFLIELDFLKGIEKLAGLPVESLIHF